MTTIRRGIPSALELQYTEMKKQVAAERSLGRSGTIAADGSSDMAVDTVTLSSVQSDGGNPPKRKPSHPVTADEKQALKVQFSTYA